MLISRISALSPFVRADTRILASLTQVRHRGGGGGFAALVRPRERMILRSIAGEAKVKRQGVARFNKRFRSWAQNRVRQYRIALPVSLTADPAMMDGTYVSACVQKAASLRKHDLTVWAGYVGRIRELKDELTVEQLGYIFYGFGKSNYTDEEFYRELIEVVKPKIPELTSHSMMTIMWALRRLQIQDQDLARRMVRNVINNIAVVRPRDFIKIVHGAAYMGAVPEALAEELSPAGQEKMEQMVAQCFRDMMHPLIMPLWSDSVVTYMMERMPRLISTLKAKNLLQIYESAVMVRVQRPHVWAALPRYTKRFYVKLSQRYIPSYMQPPTDIQWDISRVLADVLKLEHRNKFRWGPYAIDIGFEEMDDEERRDCIFVDTPAAFFASSNQYLPIKKLRHEMLHELGWNVHRVRWEDWIALEDDEKKAKFLGDLLKSMPSSVLRDRAPLDKGAMKDLYFKRKEAKPHLAALLEEAPKQIELDF